jgi:predicted NAD/FAD-binding protein
MLVEIKRFHRLARASLHAGDAETTLGQFLRSHRFSAYFERHFMVPMVSCVWSMSAGDALDYPARYLFTFLHNHGMLSVKGSPEWRTVVGGSRTYVERIAKSLTNVATSTPVRTIQRDERGIEVRDAFDQSARYSGVVVATHADTALRLLGRPTALERSILGAFSYSRNETWLHSDARLLPRAGRARASWNYLLPSCDAAHHGVLVTYDMNRLQSLPTTQPQLVTLNATDRIDPGEVYARMTYEHPIYTPAAVAAQQGLGALNRGGLAFAGAYHGWGFHEDGCRSGIEAAASLGVAW